MKKIKVTQDTQFAVLGLGKFGRNIAKTLHDHGYDVVCCDINEELVDDAIEYSTYAVQADVTDEAALHKIGIQNMDVVIVALSSDFEACVVTALIVKDMGIPYIMAKANDIRQRRILEYIGVDRVVLPEKEMGEKIAYEFITNNLMSHLHSGEGYRIVEMDPQEEWYGKSLRQLKLRERESMNVIAIINDYAVKAVLDPEIVINPGDSLVVLQVEPEVEE